MTDHHTHENHQRERRVLLAFFPFPFEDEVLYSVVARYGKAMALPQGTVGLRLFGSNISAVVDLPTSLASLVSRLHPGMGLTVERLIRKNTLFPAFAPFLPAERAAQVVQGMATDKALAVRASVGLLASAVPLPQYLRYCPQCVEQDRTKWGDSFWHVSHQVPGVLLCPTHLVPLVDGVRIRDPRPRHIFFPLEDTGQQGPVITDEERLPLEDVAVGSKWLLEWGQLQGPGLVWIRDRYRDILRQKGLVTNEGYCRNAIIRKAFLEYCPPRVLARLGCPLATETYDWVTRMTRHARGAFHPLMHLLFMGSLGISPAEFFRPWVGGATAPETGVGRCLEEPRRRLLGVALTTSEDTNDSVSSPPMAGTHCRPKRLKSEDWERNRQAWLAYLASSPGASRMDLRRANPSVARWLYRHDRQWVEEHSPARKRPRNTRVLDWKSRDDELLSMARAAVDRLLDPAQRPIRLTVSRIGVEMGCLSLVRLYSSKLPKTWAYLASVAEASEQFATRRLAWVSRQYITVGIIPSRTELRRKASLKGHVSDSMEVQLSEALRSIWAALNRGGHRDPGSPC